MNIDPKYFAGSIEKLAYRSNGGLQKGDEVNDGKLSKQELEAALKSKQLEGDQLILAESLFNNPLSGYGDDGYFTHDEIKAQSLGKQLGVSYGRQYAYGGGPTSGEPPKETGSRPASDIPQKPLPDAGVTELRPPSD